MYARIMKRLPNGVREASRSSGIPHATMSRLKRGYKPDPNTLLKLMEWAGVEQITLTVGDLRRANVGSGTIHTELTYLRAALSYAEKQDWITKAPHIPLPSKPAPKEHHLTQAEGQNR